MKRWEIADDFESCCKLLLMYQVSMTCCCFLEASLIPPHSMEEHSVIIPSELFLHSSLNVYFEFHWTPYSLKSGTECYYLWSLVPSIFQLCLSFHQGSSQSTDKLADTKEHSRHCVRPWKIAWKIIEKRASNQEWTLDLSQENLNSSPYFLLLHYLDLKQHSWFLVS